MKKPKTSYQVMKSILSSYNPSYDEKMSINSFFVTRYLSCHPGSIGVSNFINRYYLEIPKNVQYDLAKQLLNGKIKWIQMPDKDKHDNKTIDSICRFYSVSITTAISYYKLMEKEEREKFTSLYDGQ